MEILLAALIIGMIICMIGIVHCHIEIEKCNTRLERNNAVYHFRTKILNNDVKEYDILPSYREMFESELPITDEEWLT